MLWLLRALLLVTATGVGLALACVAVRPSWGAWLLLLHALATWTWLCARERRARIL